MKKVLFAVVGVLVLLFGAVTVGPQFVNWNAYKDDIAGQVRQATGRALAIEGDLSLSILPVPTLEVSQVRLANIEGGSAPEMLHLEALRVKVALVPLLGLEVQVEEVTLVTPEVLLEKLPDGRGNWEFAALAAAAETAPRAPGAQAQGGGPPVRLDRVSILGGHLLYRDLATGTEERIDIERALISAQSLEGPFEARANIGVRGVPLKLTVSAGRLAPDRPMPLAATVELGEDKARIEIKGRLDGLGDGATPSMKGTIALEGARLADALAAAGAPADAMPALLAQAFRLDGELAASPAELSLNDLTGQFAGTRLTGAVVVDLADRMKADMALSVNQLSLDDWLATTAPPQEGAQPTSGEKSGVDDATGGGGFTLPTGIDATLDLTVDALAYKGGLVRQGRINLALGDGVLAINQAGALLPGGSEVTFFGFLTAEKGQPKIEGNVEMVSDNLRTVLGWLEVDVGEIPPDRLRKAALTAHLTGTPREFQVAGVDLSLDASRLTGGVAVVLRERLAFGVGLKVDRINLDSYLGAGRVGGKTDPGGRAAGAETGAPSALPVLSAFKLLDAFDANLQAEVDRLVYNGVEVGGAHLDGTLFGGTLMLRRAGARNLAGASASLSGEVGEIGTTPELKNLKLAVKTQDVTRLARLVGAQGVLPATVTGAFTLDVHTSGGLNKMVLDATSTLVGATVRVKGELSALALPPRLGFAVSASHPDLTRLVDTLGWEYRPAARNLGGVSIKGEVKGDPAGLTLTGLKLALGPINMKGNGGLAFGGARPKVTADLTASEVLVDLFLPVAAGAAQPPGPGVPARASGTDERWSTELIHLAGLNAVDAEILLKAVAVTHGKYRVDQPRLEATLKDGVLEVRRLDGTMFGGSFSMTGRITAPAAGEQPTYRAAISVTDAGIRQALFDVANMDIADGKMDMGLEVASAGRSVFNLVSNLGGDAQLEVRDGVVEGFDLDAVSERLNRINNAVDLLKLLESGMTGGKTRFTRFGGTFKIQGGVVRTDDLKMTAQSGEGLTKGFVNLSRWTTDINTRFRLTEHANAPPFGMRTVGPLDAPRQVFDIKELQAYLLSRGVGTILRKVLPGKTIPRAKEVAPEPAPATPGGGPPPRDAPPSTQEAPTKLRPEDILRGILGGLGR